MKDELSGNIMTKFFGLRARIYSYLTDDSRRNRRSQSKSHKKVCHNAFRNETMIHVNKIENRIIFKTKTRYNLELFRLETTKFLRSNTSKITKNKNV